METLMLLTYSAICIAIFKIFKIPLNKWTVPTAILGGVVLIGGSVIVMNYNHPFTEIARTTVATTPIVPLVKGTVVEVPVQPNTPLKKGDVLFRLDPTSYQAKVDEQKAALAEAEQGVKILEQNWIQAKAELASVEAIRDRTQGIYDRYATANKNAKAKGRAQPYSAAEILNREETFNAAEADYTAAKAEAESARLALNSQISGENTDVAQVKAELAAAEFDLEQTTIRAPTDGMVTQMILRPGMIAVPAPLRPTMIFVHKDKYRLVASFVQNSLRRLQPGNEAEVIFRSIPGHVFKGKIDFIQPVMAEGEVQATGRLLTFGDVSDARVPVQIILDEDISSLQFPVGIAAEVAIYTDHMHHVAIIRKMLLRMKSWQNFVFGPLH